MNKILLLITALLVFSFSYAKPKKVESIKITYKSSYNRKVDESSSTVLQASNNVVKLSYLSSSVDKNTLEQFLYLNFNDSIEYKTAVLSNGDSIYSKRNFTLNKGLTFLDDTETIAGYKCRKAKTVINSNTIEIWYTDKLHFIGTPQPGVGIPQGMVLKVVRNGSSIQEAVKVDLSPKAYDLLPIHLGNEVSATTYAYRVQQNNVISVDVFDHESIYFRDIPKVEKLEGDKVLRFANGSLILKKVHLPENNKGYSIFAELTQYAEGDAYDRTGSVFFIPDNNVKEKSLLDGLIKGLDALPKYTDKHGKEYQGMVATSDYTPPVELMRFFTSFGVRGYNHIQVSDYVWPDSILYKQEVTDYASDLKGDVWVGAWIGNYAHNGHNVTLKIKYYPSSRIEDDKIILPLFATVNILEMAGQEYPGLMFKDDSLTVNFDLKDNLENAYIKYISTGHGGWGGGDEFNPKLNEVFLDGEKIISYTPWRDDCGSYRQFNPASGNFSNGLSSSDLSRSGWCPGMSSFPVYIHVGSLKAGNHTLKVAIPLGEPEGTSFSYWCTSGVLVGDKED